MRNPGGTLPALHAELEAALTVPLPSCDELTPLDLAARALDLAAGAIAMCRQLADAHCRGVALGPKARIVFRGLDHSAPAMEGLQRRLAELQQLQEKGAVD